jgi:predicted nucleotidyltransferase
MNEEQEIISKIIEIAKEFGVTKLILFGSATQSFKVARDIDLACDGLYDKRFFSFGAKLEDVLKKSVDLIPLNPRNSFIDEIVNTGKLIYER